jgi:hypothetical protein
MWRRVDLVWTDVSEERIASIFREEKSVSYEPAWAGGCRLHNLSNKNTIVWDVALSKFTDISEVHTAAIFRAEEQDTRIDSKKYGASKSKHRLQGPPSLLYNGYRGLFLRR